MGKTTKPKPSHALVDMGAAIDRALEECPTADVLSVLTGSFVGITVELFRRAGHDPNLTIQIDGGTSRDITIHPPKQ